jgi:hypothetical protein
MVAMGAALMTLLRDHRSLRLRIQVRGQDIDVHTPTLFVGNSALQLQLQQLGFAQAEVIETGELASITLKQVGRLAMLWLMLRGALGQLGEAEQVARLAFRELTVKRVRALGSQRIKMATDGEVTWLQLPLRSEVAREPLINVLHGHHLAVRCWSAAGADLVAGGRIHPPFVLPLHGRWPVLPRPVCAVQAGTDGGEHSGACQRGKLHQHLAHSFWPCHPTGLRDRTLGPLSGNAAV